MHTNHDYILGTLSTSESVPVLPADRRRHIYVVGQTGTGKTGLLLNLMQADLLNGAGFCFLDPHGDAAKDIASLTPSWRMNDVIYLDPSDPTHTFSYNPLSNIPEAYRATTAANIVSAFKNIWGSSWGPRMEYVLTLALRLLLDTKDQSLLGIPRLFADHKYRHWLASHSRDPLVAFYWLTEYEGYDNRLRSETIAPIQNKVGILLSNPYLRSILCQNTSTLDISGVMNKGKVLIFNLAKGGLGTEPAHLLGALIVTAFSQAAETRRHIPEADRRDFTLYVDEFQNFATDSFGSILSEARKWRLALVCVNQHVAQLSESLQHAVFGNAGTIVAFRVGAQDAPILAAELGLDGKRALRETSNYSAWLRLMHNDIPREPRLIKTRKPKPAGAKLDALISLSRGRHMVPREQADAMIGLALPPTVSKLHNRKYKRRDPDAPTPNG